MDKSGDSAGDEAGHRGALGGAPAAGGRRQSRAAAFVLALSVAAATIAGCAPTRVSEAIDVLRDINAGTSPSTLKSEAPPPERRSISFAVDGRSHRGDLYVPAEPALAGMVLVPGAARTGRDDPRLVAFANTFARARFEVLVPELERMRQLQVTSDDARILADAALHMADRAPDRPLGMTAISFALGPAVLALFEPAVDEAVGLVVAVGGYYDLGEAITFFTTGSYRSGPGEPWRHRKPNAYGKWVFVLSNASRLEDPRDRAALREMAERKMDDLDADVADLARELSPQGKPVYALITNRDPERVPTLIENLPAAMQTEIRALDLSRLPLGSLETDFILIHGRDDPIIPETQSVAFAETVGDRAHLYLVDSLGHVNPEPPGPVDAVKMIGAVYRVLSFRDG